MSERSGLSDHPASGHQAWAGPALDRCPQDTPVPPGSLVAADDVEKKVCMNEDGSLSVEMKVRFQLLGEDTLRWSQRVGQASVFTEASGEGQDPREADRFCCRQEGYPWGILKPGAQGLGPYDGGCQGAFDVGQQSRPSYDIWRNPLTTPECIGPTPRRRWGPAKLSGCKRHWRQEANHRKVHNMDNASPVSTPRHLRSVHSGSCCPWTPDGDTGSDTLHPVSSASSHSETDLESGEDLCLEDTGPHGSRPETQSIERALSDTSVSAESPEESSEGGGQLHRGSSQARVMASQEQVTKGDNPCISTQSHLSLNHTGLQTEKYRQGTRGREVRGEPVLRLPLVPGHSGSQDTQSDALPAPARAPGQQRQRKQKRPAGVVCLPSVPVPYQKGHARQGHYCRDTQSSQDTALQTPMPQEREQACPGSPAPQSPSNSPSAGNQTSEDLRSPFSSSLDFQEQQATSKATTIAMSGSDCVGHSTHSLEPAGDTKCQAHSSTPTPTHGGEVGCLWDKAGTTPEPFSSSVLLDRCPEAEDPRTYHDCCCLQTAPSSPLAAPSGQTQASLSEACLGGSSFCPTPPKEQTCSGRKPASNSSTSSDHSRADGFAGPRRTLLGKSPSIRGSLEEREAGDGVTPSALPYASPDAVVREWLGNIPEKPVLMTYEMADEDTEVPSDGPEGPKEDLGDSCSLKVLEEQIQARQQPLEGATDEHPEPEGVLSGTGSVCCKLGGDLHPDATSGESFKAPAEAGIGEGTRVDHGVSLYALPTRVAASTQIMKALLGSKSGRPSSLPEVSSTVAQRLSSSAGAFIACLARLHFFDEGLGLLDGKVRLEESPKYQEMLRLSQTLWPGSELWQDQLDFSLRKLTSHQALLGTEDFTPTSSSGVDVSSGSGGSGEGSVPCVMDNTLAPEKRDLPSNIPSQRPDSRNRGYPELVSHSTVSSVSQVRACATGGEEAGKGGGRQTWSRVPEQSVHGTTREGDALSEETEGRVRERLQENSEHGKGLPEEGAKVCSQEMLAASSQDGAGSPEDTRVPTDEAGTDATSGGLWPLDGREEPTESLQHFSESNSSVHEYQSSHTLELALVEMSRPDARGCKQACIKASSGTREMTTSMVHKGSLDPDPVWVSKLLKKIEKAFMAHLADATAELRARWDLRDNDLLDQMVTELEQDVGRRLQASTIMEVRKIQSRAGRMVPEPPREALRGQTSLQTEQRRRRLQGLRNFSAVPGQGPLSLTLEDGPTLKTALGTRLGARPVEDEFCPCEICLKKKRTPRFLKDAATVSGAPVRKAFDLQQILQGKKGGSSNREAIEVAPQRSGRMLSQEDFRTVQGADEKQGLRLAQGLGVAEGEEGEGKQRLRAEKDPEILKTEGSGCRAPEEDAGAEKDGEICTGTAQESQQLEGTEIRKEETLHQSFRDEGTLESPARQGTHSVEIQEASRERQWEVEGRNQDVKEDSPWVSSGESQGRVGSENTSLDQEERLLSHHQRPGSQSHHTACSSRASSLDNCSQVSQKGSDGDLTSGDLKCTKAKNSRVLHAERKIPMMYPESSSSEQEEGPSSPRPPKQGKGEDEGSAGSLACTQVGDKVDGFGQDDLDF